MSPAKLDLTALKKSLATLRKATKLDLNDELVRDASIKRFEFTYEIAWKMMQRHLVWTGQTDAVLLPHKELFRQAARHSLIEDPIRWFDHQEGRNLTSHTYNEDNAKKVVALLKDFVTDTVKLLAALKEHHA